MTGLFSGHVDTKSPTPLYHQIFLDFKHRIISGNLADGFKFPSEGKLAKDLDVSRITVKRALNELAQQGLVERHRGSGTVVTYLASNLPNNDGFTALMDSLRKIAATTTVEVLSVDLVKPPPSIAQHLALPNSQYAQQIHRKRYYQNDPFSYVLSYSPEKVGKSWTKEELSKKPVYQLIEEGGFTTEWARQTISCEAANPFIAQNLMLPEDAPVLKLRRLLGNETDGPLHYIEVWYRSDMYQFTMEMGLSDFKSHHQLWSSVE